MQIGGRRIGAGEPTYVVAEMSANHNQSLERASEIIRAAKRAGADAVKLQTYTADTMTLESDRDFFRIQGTLWNGQSLHDLYREAHMPWEWYPDLKRVASEVDLEIFSTPFDLTAVEFLEEMDVPAYKVASFELVDLPLIRAIARTGKPMIVSTGMGTLEEIEEAVAVAREAGCRDLILLRCTSAYPSPPEEMNLRSIPDLARRFGAPAGLSDHTMGIAVPVAAVALGACLVEKHFTLSRADGGPDSAFSLEPEEFAQMVAAIRVAERALGGAAYGVTPAERESRVFRRSLFVVQDIDAGETLTEENVRSIRPGHGLSPKHLPQVLGRRVVRKVLRGEPLDWSMLGESTEAGEG